MMKTPYEVLGVSTTAEQEEIRNAYRNLAKKFHPDLNPGKKEAEETFKEINAANESIGTPEARTKFDQSESERKQFENLEREHQRRGGTTSYHDQRARSPSPTFEGIDEEVLRTLFGRMGKQSNTPSKGKETLYTLEISFKDSILGTEKEITLSGGKLLAVKIPAGVESGSKLRFPGLGGQGAVKGQPGDAYVELRVQPSTLFKRTLSNLEIELPISLNEALLGSEIKVPTIDGSVRLKVPALMGPGKKLRVPGKGVLNPKTGKRGDQLVTLRIVMPEKIDSHFKESIEAWAKRHPQEVRTDTPH
jgi:DnaJ-class molecular chaperone